MRLILILIGLSFMAAVGFVLAKDPNAVEITEIPEPEPIAPVEAPEPPEEAARETDDAASSAASLVESRPNRIVGEELIAVPDLETTRLERLPDREPLSKPEERSDDHAGRKLLHRPVATAAGIVEAQGYRIQIAGIEPTPPDATCRTEAGRDEPCGKKALTAFRYWLRGRAIECDLGEADPSGVIVAPCRLAGQDAADWLTRYGWAKATPGSAYSALEDGAREQAIGIFTLAR